MIGFFRGFLAPFRGAARILARPRLLQLAAVPLVLNVALCAATGWAWFSYASPWIETRLVDAMGLGDGFWGDVGHGVFRVVLFIASLPLLLAVYLALAGILGGPFYETLCEAVEAEELGRPAPTHGRGFLSALLAGVGVECGNFVVSFAGGIVAFAVSFAFPPFGAFAAAGIAWALAGFGYLVYPFDRLATPLRAKLATVSKRLDVALGFGAAVYVLLIPIVTVPFVAPCAVAGAALLFPGGSKRDEA